MWNEENKKKLMEDKILLWKWVESSNLNLLMNFWESQGLAIGI